MEAAPTSVGHQGGNMKVKRMDNVGIVVKDIDAAIQFFTELGLTLEGRMPIDAEWVSLNLLDRIMLAIPLPVKGDIPAKSGSTILRGELFASHQCRPNLFFIRSPLGKALHGVRVKSDFHWPLYAKGRTTWG
jgi:hypothetical protein